MKRIFSSVMALGLATTLVACGGDANNTADNSANNAETTTEDNATEDAATEGEENAEGEDAAEGEDSKEGEDKAAEGEEEEELSAEDKQALEGFESQTGDDTLVLGAGEMSGDFFRGWQNGINDANVRRFLGIEGNNGYATVVQNENGEWINNPTVLDGDPVYTENEDGSKTITYKINKGLKWSDGEEVTADDYVFPAVLLTHPSYIPVTGSTEIGADSAKGYEAFHTGATDVLAGIQKIDDYSFSYTIDSSFLPYFEEAALAAAIPFPMHAVSENLAVESTDEGSKLVAKEGYEVTEEDKKAYQDSLQQQIDKLNEDFDAENPAPEDGASEDEKAAYDEAKAAHDEEVKSLEDKKSSDVDPSVQLMEQAMLNIANEYRFAPSVVSGPYKFDKYENNMVKLKLNENYAGNAKGDKATIPNLIIQTVNANIAVDLLENGDIDVWETEADGAKIDQIRAAADEGNLQYNTFERNGYGNITFLTDRGDTQYKEVRQAIAHLMDRNTFVQSFAGGYGVVVNGNYGTSQWMYKERGADLENGKINNYQLNIDKANEVLDASPFKFEADGKTPWDRAKADEAFANDPDNFDYWRYDENGDQLNVNQYGSEESPITALVSNQLPINAKQAGFEYNVTAGSFATLLDYYYNPAEDPDYTAFNMGTAFSAVYDPWYQYNSAGNDNKTRTNDPKADELTVKLRQTDPEDREGYLDTWEEFEIWFNDYLPEIPLYSNQYHTGYTNRVQGFDVNTPTWGLVDQINAITLK